ncbi:MAG: adenylyltransferase [bacterium]|nr:MAG: adenylyltransferase [bacterium]
MILSPLELEQYKRQLLIDGFEIESQSKLKAAKVLVAGIGGLGGTVAIYLAAAGIGKLIFIHEGDLTHSDLNRQILMTANWAGKSRVVKAKETIESFNPNVEIEILDEAIEIERLKGLLTDVDIIIDCRHNFPERRILNKAAIETNTPMIEAAMNNLEGYLFNIIPGKTPCLECMYPEDPEWDPYGFPVLGAVSGTLCCLSAMEAIKLLTGFEEPLLNQLLYFDLGNMRFQKYETHKAEDCKLCQSIS